MRRMNTALLCAITLIGLSGCGNETVAQTPTNDNSRSGATAQADNEATLPDGLTGSCTGSPYIPNNHLGSVSLKTENGNLDISVPYATDMILADIGYFINIYSAKSEWTQVRIEYFNDTGEKNVYVTKLFGDGTTKKVGTFDVDHTNNNQLSVSVPTSLITGDHGITWNAALDMNGKDIAFCPANQQDKADLSAQ